MAVQRWALQQIFDVTYKNVLNTEILATLDDLKTASVEMAEEVVYSSGGVGNAYLTSHSHSKRTTGTCTAATNKNEVMGLITGTPVVVGATTVPINNEVRTVNSDTATSVQTAAGTADAEFKGVYPYNSDGTRGNKLTQVATVTGTGEYSYDSGTKTITFFAGDFADGDEVTLFYEATTDAEASTIANDTGEFSEIVRIEMDTLVQDVCDGQEYGATLIIYKAKLTGGWMLDVAADGDVATLDVSFEALKGGCTNSKLWDLIIVEDYA